MKRFTTLLAIAAFACTLTAFASGAATTAKSTPKVQAAAASTAPATQAKPTAKHHAAKPAMKAAAAAHEMVDLNTASKEDLMKLPGIGEATADKIVAGRPFKMKSELLQKGMVNKAQYAKLRGWVVAKQTATASK